MHVSWLAGSVGQLNIVIWVTSEGREGADLVLNFGRPVLFGTPAKYRHLVRSGGASSGNEMRNLLAAPGIGH